MDIDLIQHLATGFGAALTLKNLGFALMGCLLGTLIGVLPGIGPIPTIAMLLPFSFGLEPLSSLIMLAGIYYGAQYGGSTTSILVNMPGEAPARPSASRRLGRSSPAASVPSSSLRSGCRSRSWRCGSTPRNISR